MKRPDPALWRLLLFLGSLTAILVVLIVFRSIFFPLLLGLGIAYVLDPPVTWLERRGWPRVLGVTAITLLVLLGLLGVILYVVPTISEQVSHLAERLPQYRERLEGQVKPWLTKLQARYPEEFEEMRQRALETIRQNLPRLAGSVARWLGRAFGSLLDFLLFLLDLIFVPVFAFYLLVDFPRIKRGITDLIPVPYREGVLARVREMDQAVASFLRGQLVIALILAVINATGLMLVRVPMGLLIGILSGVANLIPYMALVVGLVPALLLSWAEHQSLPLLLGAAAVFTGSQLLEGTYLGPRILSRTVNLHPVWVLLAIIAGGRLFGFFGMLLAVPVTAAIQVFVRHWVQVYRGSRVYRGEEERKGGDLTA